MHFQPGHQKLVPCVGGAILDVIVDIAPEPLIGFDRDRSAPTLAQRRDSLPFVYVDA